MTTSASPAPITSVLTAMNVASPTAASSGAATNDGGAATGFAQLMQNAISRQAAPDSAATSSGRARSAATAVSSADAPTPQALLDSLQQLIAQSQSATTPTEISALRAQWQTFAQQLAARLNAQGEGDGQSSASAASDELAWEKIHALAAQFFGVPTDADAGSVSTEKGVQGLLKRIQQWGSSSDVASPSGDAAWLAALQHQLSHGGTDASQQTTGSSFVSRSMQAALGTQGASNSMLSATSILPSAAQSGLSQSAQSVFAQLISAQSNEKTVAPASADNTALNGISSIPLGFSVPAGTLQSAPLSLPSPLMLQQPDGAGQLGQNIQWMVGQHISRANLNIHPEHLGPLQISIDQKNDQTNIQITTAHPLTRDLLDQQMPKLREWLNDAGLANAQITLNLGQSGQQNAGQSAGQSSRDGSPSAASSASSSAESAAIATDATVLTSRITRLGVDTFV